MSSVVREEGLRDSVVLVQRAGQLDRHFLQSFGSHNPEFGQHILIVVGRYCCQKSVSQFLVQVVTKAFLTVRG